MSAPIAATAVRNYLSGSYMGGGSQRIQGYGATLASNPNDLALALNLIIPFVLVFVGASHGCFTRLFTMGIATLNIAAVLVTFSRTGFLTLVTILLSTLVGLFRSWKLIWGFALVAVLLASLPFLPSSLWQRWATITNIESDETGSAQARRNQLLTSIRFVITHPIVGTGLGNGVLGLRDEGLESWSEVHNAYLQYGVELGIPGLALYVALVVASIKSASPKPQSASTSPEAQALARLAQATRLSLIAYAVAAFFHPVAYHFYFYYLAGLAVAAGRLQKMGTDGHVQGPTRRANS
jgi:O-antigen ligase